MKQGSSKQSPQLEFDNKRNQSWFDSFWCCCHPSNLDIDDNGARLRTSEQSKFREQQNRNNLKEAVKEININQPNQIVRQTKITEVQGFPSKINHIQSLPQLQQGIYFRPRTMTSYNPSIIPVSNQQARQSLTFNQPTSNSMTSHKTSKIYFSYIGKDQQITKNHKPLEIKVPNPPIATVSKISQPSPVPVTKLNGQKQQMVALVPKKIGNAGSPKLSKKASKHFNNTKIRQTVSICDDSDSQQSVVLSRSELAMVKLLPINEVEKESIVESQKKSIGIHQF